MDNSQNQKYDEFEIKVFDEIYVPSINMDVSKPLSLENCDIEEGLATISRIVKDHLNNLYVYCFETGGCICFKWNDIKNIQHEIKNRKGFSRAFIKFNKQKIL